MALLGSWFGFQFIGTLYMQNLRGWSPIEMACRLPPGRADRRLRLPKSGDWWIRVGPCRSGRRACQPHRPPTLLFWNIGADSGYLSAMLPIFYPHRDRVHARLRALTDRRPAT